MSVRIAILLLVLMGATSSSIVAQGLTKEQKERLVVVISLDGFPAYAFDDPLLPVPTLRRLMKEGSVASAMQPVNPTVTWPNHTAMVTGVDAATHHVVFNGLLEHHGVDSSPVIEPWRPKDEMVKAPTVYDLAFQAGLTTAQVDWVAIHEAKTITWKFPEIPNADGAIEKEMITAGTITEEQVKKFDNGVNQPWQDQMWAAAAADILEKHKPNLLLLHFLDLDDINHEYGPKSVAYYTAVSFLDDRVKQILQAIDNSGRMKDATVLIVSDHGFRTIHHTLHGNVLLKEKGVLQEAAGALKGSAWVMADGGVAMVYVTDPAQRATLVPKLREIFSGAEGVERVYGTEDFAELGFPKPEASEQGPDLVLAAKADYGFNNDQASEYVSQISAHGTHGFLNSDPQMQAIFIGWGKGIKPGVNLGKIKNRDVAPTVANLLGLDLKTTEGQALKQMLLP